MKLTDYEREIVINFNEEEKTASVYTHNRALQNKLEKLALEYPEDCKPIGTHREGAAVEYTVPKKLVKVSPPRKVSDEQREAARKRFQKFRYERDG